MLPALMAGASILSSYMGSQNRGGGSMMGSGSAGSADTNAAGPSNAWGGLGPNTQSSPFIINSGGSTMKDSGSVSNRFAQDISPNIDQTSSASGAKPTTNSNPGTGSIYTQPQGNSLMSAVSQLPQSTWYILGGLVVLILIIALVSGKRK